MPTLEKGSQLVSICVKIYPNQRLSTYLPCGLGWDHTFPSTSVKPCSLLFRFDISIFMGFTVSCFSPENSFLHSVVHLHIYKAHLIDISLFFQKLETQLLRHFSFLTSSEKQTTSLGEMVTYTNMEYSQFTIVSFHSYNTTEKHYYFLTDICDYVTCQGAPY